MTEAIHRIDAFRTPFLDKPNLPVPGGRLAGVFLCAVLLVAGGAAGQQQGEQSEEETPQGEEEQEEIIELPEGEEITVVGFAGALQRAAAIKRSANQIVDAISAEDIGKLPDPNIADALQRVTGVQLRRQDNAGREVSLRGLSSFFTKVTVNGIGVVPGAAADDSAGLDIGVLGADLGTALEVYKTPTAKQVEGAVGGTVNVRTARPLEQDAVITGRLRANYEPLEGGLTPVGSVGIGRTFGNEFGLILDVYSGTRAYRRDAYHDDRSGGFRSGFGDVNGDGIDDLYPDKSRTRYNEREDDDSTYNLSMQWRPAERVTFSLDATASEKDKFRQYSQNEIRWHSSELVPGTAVVDGNNTIVEAQFSELRFLSRSSVRRDGEELGIYNLGAEYTLGDRLFGTGSISFTSNVVEERTQGNAVIEIRGFELPDGQFFGYRLSGGDAGFSFINPGGFDLSDPAHYQVPGRRLSFNPGGNFDFYDHEQTAVQKDFTLDMGSGFWNTLDFGARWFSRREERVRPGHEFTGDVDDLLEFYNDPERSPSDYGDLLGIGGFDPFVYPDSWEMFLRAQSMGWILPDAGRTDRLFEDNYDSETDSWAAYAQFNGSGELFGKPVRGNVGLRVVGTDFASTGVTVVNDRDFDPGDFAQTRATVGHDYTRVLPSANIALEVTDRAVLRAAVARVMKRPRPEDTRAAVNVYDVVDDADGSILPPDSDDGAYVAFNGNPELDPFVADQIDFSAEYYTHSGGLLSAGVFYKDVSDLTGFGSTGRIAPLAVFNPITRETITVEALLTSPVNIDGQIEGFELAVHQVFSFLPAPFDGLGVQANYTFTDATDEEGRQIPGTSEEVYNFVAFYEAGGFGVRLAWNYRDSFLDAFDRGATISLPDGSTIRGGRWTDENRRLDLSAFYEVNENLMITVEGVNLTDEANRSYLDGLKNRINTHEQLGTRWLAGIRFKL
ncbi:MAG: TonB-dependent receptor [Acidobacteria bacterium]|nr:TonB-dependent receptor [Acidobacteriota bacterium]MCY3970267.1 TonB-dependent receptor [Acidobacteriota bacterium]